MTRKAVKKIKEKAQGAVASASSLCHASELDANSLSSDSIPEALGRLSSMAGGEKMRKDAILNAKAIIKNWKPPTDAQIKTIIISMSKELLA